MFQIIFNELSAAEISALPKKLQLELLAEFQILPEDLDHLDSERFGVIQREEKSYIATVLKIIAFISRKRTKASQSGGFFIRTRSAIFFSGPNCRSRKMRNWARDASFGN